MKIHTVFFSPTGNTKKSVNSMAEAITKHIGQSSNEYLQHDCTVTTEPVVFDEDDFVIFGAPVYAGRIPEVSKERFKNFRGKNTSCLIVASYGNRHYDDALMEMKDMVLECGFVVKGAAAVIGRHTYGEIQVDRPNADDLKQMGEFARKAYENDHIVKNIPGNPIYREGGKGGKFKPSTLESCVKCGICKKNCPVAAIREDFSVMDEKCISCFRCIRNCPVEAKVMHSESYEQFAADFTKKLSQRRENEFYI